MSRRARAMRLGAAVVVAMLPSTVGARQGLPSFQALVDATPDGQVLRPAPGEYAGPIVIERPIHIDGRGQVTIRGDGESTVVVIHTDGAVLEGLHLTGSGSNHDDLDAGVQVRGDGNVIRDNVIDDCLFGIDLQQSDGNVLSGNRISSKPFDMGVRGDGIRLWYSMKNQIVDNELVGVRDTVVWYSADNLIARNRSRGNRYALHFMYAQRNHVEDNDYRDNLVGIFLMYSDGVEVRRNRIVRSTGPTGMGIGFKETSGVVVEDNTILYCATGIYLDISPYEPDTVNVFRRNRIGFHGVGVVFHTDWHGNDPVGGEGIVATGGSIHDAVIAALNEKSDF